MTETQVKWKYFHGNKKIIAAKTHYRSCMLQGLVSWTSLQVENFVRTKSDFLAGAKKNPNAPTCKAIAVGAPFRCLEICVLFCYSLSCNCLGAQTALFKLAWNDCPSNFLFWDLLTNDKNYKKIIKTKQKNRKQNTQNIFLPKFEIQSFVIAAVIKFCQSIR